MHNVHDKITGNSSQTKTEEKKKMYFGDIEYSVDMQDNVFQAYDESKIPKRTIKFDHFIKLPLYRQGYDFTCGVACVMSILRYAGYEFDTREDRLLWKLGSTPAEGTNYLAINEYLNSIICKKSNDMRIIETIVHECDYASKCSNEADVEKLLTELRNAIDNDSPVICAIQAWKDDGEYASRTEDDGHYVVLIGYEEYREGYIYYFMDPSTAGNYTYLTEEEFILRWHDEVNTESKRIGIEVNKESKRIGIEVKYKNLKTEFSGDVAYHLE